MNSDGRGEGKVTFTRNFAGEDTAECFSAGEEGGLRYGLLSEVLPDRLNFKSDEVFFTSTGTPLKRTL